LHRGIYEAVVYRAQTVLSGKFMPPDFAPLKIELKDVQWKDAFVTIAINDLRGTREANVLDWGGTKRPMLPGSQVPGYTTGATASLGNDQPIGSEVQFSIPLDFNGSEGIFTLRQQDYALLMGPSRFLLCWRSQCTSRAKWIGTHTTRARCRL